MALIRSIAFFLLICRLAPFPVRAQEPVPGKIIPKVLCAGDASQSYALYLPSRYSADRKWPILFCFDPGARGLLPVQRFMNAAEKYGYIVAGSNNSRNGPMRIVEEAAGAMLHDANSRFSLDPRRTYLAGFSGGARVAVGIGLAMKERVAGIFACGAGFPPSVRPDASIPFAFFGAAGNDDFNYPELRKLDGNLEELGIAHEFESFQGGHEWAPEAVCTHALEWMELQAMKSGIVERNEEWIHELFAARIAGAESAGKSNRQYESYRRYSSIAADFSGLADVTKAASEAKLLERSKAVGKALDQEKNVEERQRRLEGEAARLEEDAFSGDNRMFAAQEFRRLIDNLNSEAKQTRNEVNRSAAARALLSVWIGLNEAATEEFQRREFRRAAARLELMAQMRPGNAGVDYQLSRAHALLGDRKAAIAALKNAVKKGFADPAALEQDRDLDILKNEPEFKAIIEDLRANKKAAAT